MLYTFKQILKNGLTKEEFENYYNDNHTLLDVQEHFNIGEKVCYRLFCKFNIKKRSIKDANILSGKKRGKCWSFINSVDKNEFVSYYKTHSRDETLQHYNISSTTYYKALEIFKCTKTYEERYEVEKRLLKDKFGVENMFQRNDVKKTIIDTFIRKYGVENYSQTSEFHKKSTKRYTFNGINFDSSWELALYIFSIINGDNIIRLPVRLEYKYKNKKYYYFPDFMLNGLLIEVKGNHLIDKNKNIRNSPKGHVTGKTRAKTRCMKENNVKILVYKDIKKYLDWCKENMIDLQKYRNK